jgi:photosystem II stability/assembly factor-like uncharacterized protein
MEVTGRTLACRGPAGLPPFLQNWRIIEGGGSFFMMRIAQGILGFLVLLAMASPALAQPEPNPWSPFGPGGGSVSSVAVDPRSPSTLYAATVLVYKSVDGGTTWKAVVGPDLSLVAVAPDQPETVFAAGDTVMRSTDGGRSWQNTLPPGQNVDTGVQVLTVGPGGLVFAGTYNRLLRSADGGQTWSQVLGRRLNGTQSVQVDPSDPSRVYAATGEAFYVSTDGGEHWQSTARPEDRAILRLALAPSAPRTLYALTGDAQIFRSDDGAVTWRKVGEVSADQVLLVDPRSASRVYAAGLAGFFVSTDGGGTWMESNLGLPRPGHEPLGILSLAAAPSLPDFLFAGTRHWGVAQSYSAGARWRIGFQAGLNSVAVQMLEFHPLRPGTVYVGTAGGGYDSAGGVRSYRSTDNGRTWQPFARSISQDGLNALAFDRTNPDLLYAATPVGTWKSTDGGESWTRTPSDEAGRYLDVVRRETLLSSRCGVRRSMDGGVTWQEMIPCQDEEGDFRDPLSLSVDPKGSGIAYVHFLISNGASRHVYEAFKSQDGGTTWKELQIPGGFSQLAVAPSDFRVLYALSTQHGKARLLRSMDGGETWKTVNRSVPRRIDILFGSMAVDGADPYRLYLTALDGILVSRDSGRSLELIDAPLEASRTGTSWLWTDRTQPGRVFATPGYGNGLFVGRFE